VAKWLKNPNKNGIGSEPMRQVRMVLLCSVCGLIENKREVMKNVPHHQWCVSSRPAF